MESRSFLEALLPSDGFYVLGALALPTEENKKPALHNKFYQDIESLLRAAQSEQDRGRDVYITPASFSTNKNRQASNAQYVKSFFLDLDVGPEHNKYPSKKDAVEALYKFIESTGLPAPTLVDSGGGVHVYWLLNDELPVKQWYPLAVRLKKLCAQYEFKIDPTVTADAARIMRLVGFKNLKRGGKQCVVRGEAAPVDVEDISSVLDEHMPAATWLEQAQNEWMRSSNLAKVDEVNPDRISKFSKIVRRSVGDSGCAQIARAVVDQAHVAEPVWRAVLSIAWHCEDADKAIHKASCEHPEYDADITVAKAMATKGPYHCETFESLNPGGCEGCPHRGKITSPIVLGAMLKEAPATEQGYEVQEQETVEREGEETPTFIPPYPRPFFRPNSGGLAVALDGPDGEILQITDIDFWVQSIIRDPRTGAVSLWMRTWHKVQGYSDFLMPNCINQGSEIVKHLEKNGMIFDKRAETAIRRYLYTAVNRLNNTERALVAVDQMGWSDDYESFIIGENRFIKNKPPAYAPPSEYTGALATMYASKGTLKGWQREVQRYFDDTKLGSWQTMVLAAFASPLYVFTGKSGLIISFTSSRSGLGKSTAQKAGMAAFGNPKHLMLTIRDTFKSKMERAGVLQNLPIALEETTLMKPEELVALTYAFTEGRSNNQANMHGGGEKISNRTWSMIATSSSNVSLVQAINSGPLKHNPDANLARVFEFGPSGANSIGTLHGLGIEKAVQENYGHAGRVFVQYLVDNAEQVRNEIAELQENLYLRLNAEPKERFMVAGITCLIYAAQILNQIGLLSINVTAYTDFLFAQAKVYVGEVKEVMDGRASCFSEYMRKYSRNMLQIAKNMDKADVVRDYDRMTMPIMGRVETDEGQVLIPLAEFRRFCSEMGTDFEDEVRSMQELGILLEKGANVRLLKGVPGSSSVQPVRCLRIKSVKD